MTDTASTHTTGGPTLITLGDVQGSAQVTVDGSGAVTRNAYTPYGVKRAGSTIASAHGWLNQIADADTGLTYLNARYYDPALGRFLSPDPLLNPGDPRTLDPYRYADNNPVVYMDASGLNPSCGPYSAATQVCWSSYVGESATDPATKAAHKTVVQNSKGKIAAPSGSECMGMLATCRAIGIWNDTMPFTPISLDKAYRYNTLLRARLAPEIHVPSTLEIIGATAGLTAYEFFAGDAERCAGGSASDCGFAALGVIPGLGKLAKLGKVGSLADDVAVIGRQADTAALKGAPGHEVLDVPPRAWTPAVNDQWVKSVVDRRMDVYVGSNPTFQNSWDVRNARPTVFARELQQFQGAGYTWDGWYLRAPAG